MLVASTDAGGGSDEDASMLMLMLLLSLLIVLIESDCDARYECAVLLVSKSSMSLSSLDDSVKST